MISIKEAQEVHKILIETFGGSYGIRDIAGLESAPARFGGRKNYRQQKGIVL